MKALVVLVSLAVGAVLLGNEHEDTFVTEQPGISYRQYRLTDPYSGFREENGFLFGAKINVNKNVTEFKKLDPKTGEIETLFTRPRMRRISLSAAHQGYFVWSETELVTNATGTSYKETYLYIRTPAGKLTQIRQLKDWGVRVKTRVVGTTLFYGFFSRKIGHYQLFKTSFDNLAKSQNIFQERSVVDYGVDEDFAYLVRHAGGRNYHLERYDLRSGTIKKLYKAIVSQEQPKVLVHKGDLYIAESERGRGQKARLLRRKKGTDKFYSLYENTKVREPQVEGKYVYLKSGEGVVRISIESGIIEKVPVHFPGWLRVGPNNFFLGGGRRIRQYSSKWFIRQNPS